ncbi:MAG: type II secretion system minor pseudopilin GspI [Nevskiaceae bacterium]
MTRRAAAGFTLVEIVVAVAVLAVAMGALITGMARYADNAATLREKTVALWVAHNRLTEIGLEPAWPELGKSDGEVELAGIEWRWDVSVVETPDPRVRRVDIEVRPGKAEAASATLSSFVQDQRQ